MLTVIELEHTKEWPYRLSVRSVDSQSIRSGSIPDMATNALVLELAYRLDLKPSAERIVGPTPTWSTKKT